MSTVALHHVEDGPGGARPVLLGGSLGTTVDLWRPQLSALAQHHRVVSQQPPDLPGVAIKSMGALAGEIEHQLDMVFLAWRYLEHLVKRRHFLAGDVAIRPRHLGSERDRRDRERHSLARVGLGGIAPRTRARCHMVGDTVEQ